MGNSGQPQFSERVPCAFCLHTLNVDSPMSRQREIVVSADGEYYHKTCLGRMADSFDTTPTRLPLVAPLTAVWRKANNIDIEVTNSLSDTPLGISDSSIYLRAMKTSKFSIKNNSHQDQMVALHNTPPWLHVEMTAQNDRGNVLFTPNGRVLLGPEKEVALTLVPHLVRPYSERRNLILLPGHYLVLYSGGNDSLVWTAFGIICIFWLFFWLSFTSPGTTMANFTIWVADNPMAIIASFIRLYLFSALLITIMTIIMPSRVLWYIRQLLFSIRNTLPLDTPGRWLATLDEYRIAPGRLHISEDNIGTFLLHNIGFGFAIALPFSLILILMTMLFVNVFAIGSLFYLLCFAVSVILLFSFLRTYDLPKFMSRFGSLTDAGNELLSQIQSSFD